jgi:signal transduction histidine kinase
MSAKEDPARLEALLAEQAALRRVATLVARGTPAPELFDWVCKELGGVLDVKSTDMIRYEKDSAVVVGAWAARGAPAFPVGERVPIEDGTVTAKLLRTGHTQRVNDYEDVEGPLAARLRSAGIRSVIGAPITVSGRLWGGVMATSERPYSFPSDTEQRIGNFAELVTAALANVVAREQLAASRSRLVAAGDAARRRIERDLHDGAQQRLVSLALNLRLIQSHLEASSDAAAELEAARIQLDEALQELRELARGIHPSVLTERGLGPALASLAKRSPVPVDLEVDGTDALPLGIQTTAYFVAAEALTNAAKHARCERATVRVLADDELATIEVRDDGIGGTNPAQGSGLRGLADRVSAIGGELEVESPAGGGTTVRARIGLAAAPEPERMPPERAAGATAED